MSILQYAVWSMLVTTCMTARVATVPWSSLAASPRDEHPCEPLGCPSTECIGFCLDQTDLRKATCRISCCFLQFSRARTRIKVFLSPGGTDGRDVRLSG